jgi:hypothetical protein
MVMQQEMFDCELLNYLALLSCCRWALFDAATDRHLSYTTTDTTGTTTASADESYENEEDMVRILYLICRLYLLLFISAHISISIFEVSVFRWPF